MKLALFFLFCFVLILTGCAAASLPTAPEQAVIAHASDKSACTPRPRSIDMQDCSLYVILNDRSMGRLAEIRHGIPYIEPSSLEEPVRYQRWLDRMQGRGRSLEQYVGPYEEEYNMLLYSFSGQEPERVNS